jgi:predicted amino acid dehydrogenase
VSRSARIEHRRQFSYGPYYDPQDRRFRCTPGRGTHPTHARSLAQFDPSFNAFSSEQPKRFSDEFVQESDKESDELAVIGTARIASPTGAVAYGEFINIPYSAEALTRLPLDRTVKTIRKAVAMARDRGARIVGLGAFTSIVTRNGLLLRDLGVALTTGNSYTVVATVEGLRATAQRRELDLAGATVAIVGATGSIGRAVVDGGVIRVPGGQDVGFSFGLPPGAVYACMAETMMLGLEHRSEHGSLGGQLNEDFLRYVRELSSKHGFTLDRE